MLSFSINLRRKKIFFRFEGALYLKMPTIIKLQFKVKLILNGKKERLGKNPANSIDSICEANTGNC